MPGWWAGSISKREILGAVVCALAALAVAISFVIRNYLRRRPTAEEVERRRRGTLHVGGKMGDGEIIDVEAASASIIYSYSVAGVVYTASQDLTALQALLPRDQMTMVGTVSVKFDPRNPANSIVLCEEWSGLRHRALK
jgi:hypothetical protein